MMGDGSPKDSPHSDAPHRIPIEDRLDLHAFSPSEIRDLVEEYLSLAVTAGFRQVRIIHGRGSGVQRRVVRSILSRHPGVEVYGDAPVITSYSIHYTKLYDPPRSMSILRDRPWGR